MWDVEIGTKTWIWDGLRSGASVCIRLMCVAVGLKAEKT